MATDFFILQADLESILQLPGGKPHNFNEAMALRAFSLHCRLSIHLQHQVGLFLAVRPNRSTLAKLVPLLMCLSVVGQFCSEGKVYLSILEDTGFWLENKVLSFIQDQEEEYLKLHRVVYQQIIQVRSLTTWKPSLHQVCDVLPDFIFCFKVVTLDRSVALLQYSVISTSRVCVFPKREPLSFYGVLHLACNRFSLMFVG